MHTITLAVLCLLWRPAASRLVGRSVHSTRPRRLQGNIFQESDGLLVIEAESVPVVAPWVMENTATNTVTGYTGEGYIRFDGNTEQGGEPNGTMSYFFYINNPGNYTMVFRAYKINEIPTLGNDCYTKMVNYEGFQGLNTKSFMSGTSNTWRFRLHHDLGDEILTPLYEFKEPGLQELQVSGRSKNFFIDRIVFYDDSVVNRLVAEDPDKLQSESFLYEEPEQEMPETVPTALPSVFIDAGAPDEDLSLMSGVIWTSYFDVPIANVPAGFEEETFKSHRSGESFTYVLSGYKASEKLKVTLGFAENYIGNCRLGGRIMNITVNGDTFATELDVFGRVGCYEAMTLSGEYAADSSGNIVIDFQPIKQNPFVSFIGVDSLVDDPQGEIEIQHGVVGFTLISTEDAREIGPLSDGMTIDLADIGSLLSIRADTVGYIESVLFHWEGMMHRERVGPYAMHGDNYQQYDAVDYLATPGTKTVVAEAYDANGLINSYTVSFNVVGEDFGPDFGADSYQETSSASSTLFFNAGAEDDKGVSAIDGTVRTYFAYANVTGVPPIYTEAVFQSHVYGESFTYTIPDFAPGETAVVTLGFAEIYRPNCKLGKRIFDVSVNEEVFASNLDIFSQVGCEASLVMSGEFVANENGELVIQFSPIEQNPMVSFIETTVYVESEPVDVPAESDMSDLPSSVPSDFPSDFPSFAPASDFPSDAPSSMPVSEEILLSCIETNAAITGFSLIDTTDSFNFGDVVDGDSISLAFVGPSIAVRANTIGPVEYVVFLWDGTSRREGAAPWDMVGSTAADYLSTPGVKSVEAEVYDECGLRDVKSVSFTMT